MNFFKISVVFCVLLGMESTILLPDYGTKRKTQTSQQAQQKRPTERPIKTSTAITDAMIASKNEAITALQNFHAQTMSNYTQQDVEAGRKNIEIIKTYLNQGGILTENERQMISLGR